MSTKELTTTNWLYLPGTVTVHWPDGTTSEHKTFYQNAKFYAIIDYRGTHGYVDLQDVRFEPSVADFIKRGRDAGQDAFGLANDEEFLAQRQAASQYGLSPKYALLAKLDPGTPPEQVDKLMRGVSGWAEDDLEDDFDEVPVGAVPETQPVQSLPKQNIVSTTTRSTVEPNAPIDCQLVLYNPGNAVFELVIDKRSYASVPFDNLVKALVRLDPDHASGPEKQIASLKYDLGTAQGKLIDHEIKIDQLTKLNAERSRIIDTLNGKLNDAKLAYSKLERDLDAAFKALVETNAKDARIAELEKELSEIKRSAGQIRY